MNALAPLIGAVGIILAVGWVVRGFLANRKQVKLTAMRNEMQTKILDKFGAGEELLTFLDSPAGQRFASSNSVEAESSNYHQRILGSVQTGIIITVLGAALLFLSRQLGDEALLFLGTFGVALGVGFLGAAVASFVLSKRWGLLDRSEHELTSERPVE